MWNEFNQALSLAARRVIVGVADLLPGVLAMAAAILLALPLAWLAGFLVRRSLKRLRFDERIALWGFSEVSQWSPSRSATVLVARVVSWAIIVFGLLVGLTALNANFTSGMTLRDVRLSPQCHRCGCHSDSRNLLCTFCCPRSTR